MAGYVILGMLSAFGALCAGWLVYGWMIPRSRGTVLILGDERHRLLRRCLWLREMRILDVCIAVVDVQSEEMDWLNDHGVQIWEASPLGKLAGTGAERNGTGTGDPPGRHQCGGVSEL